MVDKKEAKQEPAKVIEVIETPLFTCACGCRWFEKKQMCEFQHGSKYAADNFVPTNIMNLLRCAHCGAHHNEDGNRINLNDLMK